MEAECEVVYQAHSKSCFILGVVELLLTMPVTEKTGICRQTEVPVDCVAYSRLGSNAYAVPLLTLARDIIAELECAFPKEVEPVERVYEVSEIGRY